jgi:hypothetical protein
MQFDAKSPTKIGSTSEQGRAAVRQRRQRRQYWVIFGVCLVFFIVAASIARLLRALRLKRSGAPRSIWAEAKEEATLCTAAAFQG